MSTGIATNRSYIDLPEAVSNEIIQKTQEASAVMQLARKVALPGRGLAIPVITSDPEASWVSETAAKPVANPGLATKILRGYKLAVIVPFSDEFIRDEKALFQAVIDRLPGALATKFDKTVFGNGSKPGSDFDNFADVTAYDINASVNPDAYAALVSADEDVAIHGGLLNGYVISPQAKGILLASRDNDGRPLFINNVAEGAIPMILGSKTVLRKAAFKAGTPSIVGFAGDWTQAIYGIVNDVKIDFSSEATLTLADSSTINLFQNNMTAVRAEIEIGFRADTSVFTALSSGSAVPTI